ncbi:MAG: magnesium transporter [Flavobacteriales bacterium]
MSFELTKSLLDRIRGDVADGRDSSVEALLSELHPADVAAILDRLDEDEARYIYRLLEPENAAEVILELDEDRREELLESLTSKEIAEDLIEHIDSDDAADVMSELPAEKQREVISHMDDDEQKEDLQELLTYAEGTAGAMMAKELVKVQADRNVTQAIFEMRQQAQEVEHVYTIYVVDRDDRFVGLLPLKDILFSAESTRTLVRDICQTGISTITPGESAEDAIAMMKKYDMAVLPVVDDAGRLLGRITFDDVMDVMTEEAEEDYQLASGISEDVDAADKPWIQIRARLPWLLIGIAGGILSSRIISVYESDLRIDPTMAFFMPLIAATGGNVGVQSSAIVVQGLASGDLQNVRMGTRLWKEFKVAMMNALICSGLILVVNFLIHQSQALTLTVSVALFTVILTAAFFGTLTPLIMNRLKVDPALATGPFVTTLNDIFGLLTYFTVGHLMYSHFQG